MKARRASSSGYAIQIRCQKSRRPAPSWTKLHLDLAPSNRRTLHISHDVLKGWRNENCSIPFLPAPCTQPTMLMLMYTHYPTFAHQQPHLLNKSYSSTRNSTDMVSRRHLRLDSRSTITSLRASYSHLTALALVSTKHAPKVTQSACEALP